MSYFYLFRHLKKGLKGIRFTSDAELQHAVPSWLRAQLQEFYENGIKKPINIGRNVLLSTAIMLKCNKSEGNKIFFQIFQVSFFCVKWVAVQEHGGITSESTFVFYVTTLHIIIYQRTTLRRWIKKNWSIINSLILIYQISALQLKRLAEQQIGKDKRVKQ